jgi:hypothetical protein
MRSRMGKKGRSRTGGGWGGWERGRGVRMWRGKLSIRSSWWGIIWGGSGRRGGRWRWGIRNSIFLWMGICLDGQRNYPKKGPRAIWISRILINSLGRLEMTRSQN